MPDTCDGFLGLDAGSLGSAVLECHLRIELVDAVLDPIRERLVGRVGPSELVAGDWVTAQADQQSELSFRDLHAWPKLAVPQGAESRAEPTSRRRTCLGVVAGE